MAKVRETEGYSTSQIAKGVAKVAVIGAAAVGAAYLGACGIGVAALSWLGLGAAGAAGAVATGAYVGAAKGKKGFADAADLTTREVAITAARGAVLGVGIGATCGAVGAGVGGAVMGAVGGAAIGAGVGAAATIEPKAKEVVNSTFDKVADGAKAVADVITSKEFFKSVALGSAVGVTIGILAILAAPATFGGSIAAGLLVLSIGAIAGGYIGGKISQYNGGKGLFSGSTKPAEKEHEKVHAHGHERGRTEQHAASTNLQSRTSLSHGSSSPERHTGSHAAAARRRAAQQHLNGSNPRL